MGRCARQPRHCWLALSLSVPKSSLMCSLLSSVQTVIIPCAVHRVTACACCTLIRLCAGALISANVANRLSQKPLNSRVGKVGRKNDQGKRIG